MGIRQQAQGGAAAAQAPQCSAQGGVSAPLGGRAPALVHAHVHGGEAQAEGQQGRQQAAGSGGVAGASVLPHELRREAALVRPSGASGWRLARGVAANQRTPRHHCGQPAGAGAGTRRAPLRAGAAGGRRLLRRRQRAVRGRPHRLRSLRFGLEPSSGPAHLGALNIVGGGEAVAKQVREAQEAVFQEVNMQVPNGASNTTNTAGGRTPSCIARRRSARSAAGGFPWRPAG